MQALKLLFTSDVGLFSAAVFAVLLAMIVYFVWLFAFHKDTSTAPPPADGDGILHTNH